MQNLVSHVIIIVTAQQSRSTGEEMALGCNLEADMMDEQGQRSQRTAHGGVGLQGA